MVLVFTLTSQESSTTTAGAGAGAGAGAEGADVAGATATVRTCSCSCVLFCLHACIIIPFHPPTSRCHRSSPIHCCQSTSTATASIINNKWLCDGCCACSCSNRLGMAHYTPLYLSIGLHRLTRIITHPYLISHSFCFPPFLDNAASPSYTRDARALRRAAVS